MSSMEKQIFSSFPFPYWDCLLKYHYSTLFAHEVWINFAVTELNRKCLWILR